MGRTSQGLSCINHISGREIEWNDRGQRSVPLSALHSCTVFLRFFHLFFDAKYVGINLPLLFFNVDHGGMGLLLLKAKWKRTLNKWTQDGNRSHTQSASGSKH